MESLTVERCLSRAERLRGMADRAKDYQDILTYEALANEWLVLAARLESPDAGSPDVPDLPLCTWQNFRSWFRVLDALGQRNVGR